MPPAPEPPSSVVDGQVKNGASHNLPTRGEGGEDPSSAPEGSAERIHSHLFKINPGAGSDTTDFAPASRLTGTANPRLRSARYHDAVCGAQCAGREVIAP